MNYFLDDTFDVEELYILGRYGIFSNLPSPVQLRFHNSIEFSTTLRFVWWDLLKSYPLRWKSADAGFKYFDDFRNDMQDIMFLKLEIRSFCLYLYLLWKKAQRYFDLYS